MSFSDSINKIYRNDRWTVVTTKVISKNPQEFSLNPSSGKAGKCDSENEIFAVKQYLDEGFNNN